MAKTKIVAIKKNHAETKNIGKYTVVGKISQGGMGAIYKAKHPTLNKYIILKQLIIKKSASIIERFRREASLMLDLRSEHIVQVYDHFKENSSYFIAMEYVDGISLEKLIEDKRHLSNDAALLIFSEVCKAVKYAHDREVIHRDIKPANILISRDGEVKLSDFGIAKSMDKNAIDLTKAGSALGSPAYIPPEQIFDIQNSDKTADIYSMGVTLYQMTTGKLPFPCNLNPQTVYQIQKGKYVLPKKINPNVKSIFQNIILKSIHPNKKKRFKNVDLIINILDKYLNNYTRQDVINESIKNYLRGKEISLNKSSPVKIKTVPKKNNFFKKFIYALIAGIILSAIVYFSGFYFELPLNKDYGALKIEVKTDNKDFFKYNDDIKAIIYENRNNNFYEIKSVKLSKNLNLKKSLYETGKIFLKSNQYKIYINIKNQNYENNIFIEPRAIQKNNPMKKNYELMYINLSNFYTSYLNVYFNFKDINTNEEINNVDINILYSGKWLSWSEYISNYRNDLVSGKEYNFSFRKEGYLKKDYKIYINPYESVLNAGIFLIPQTGKLILKSNSKNIKVMLDNSRYYYSYSDGKALVELQPTLIEVYFNRALYYLTGKNSGKFAKVQRNLFEDKDLILLPGEYEITSIIGNIKNKIKVTIRENRSNNVYINYDEKKKSLKFDYRE